MSRNAYTGYDMNYLMEDCSILQALAVMSAKQVMVPETVQDTEIVATGCLLIGSCV